MTMTCCAFILLATAVTVSAYEVPLGNVMFPNQMFSYNGAGLDWPNNPAWTCNGRSQSPVAINAATAVPALESFASPMQREMIAALPRGLLGSTGVVLVNNNGAVTFNFVDWTGPDQSMITAMATKYNMTNQQVIDAFNAFIGTPLQMHFHGISENTFNGQIYPTELHIVRNQSASQCQNDPSCFAVFGIWFNYPSSPYSNATLAELQKFIPAISTLGTNFTGNSTVAPNLIAATAAGGTRATPASGTRLELKNLFPADTSYYTFNGSLTGPPCTEGIPFTIFKQPQTIDIPEMQVITKAIASGFGEIQTNRWPQPLNGRSIVFVNQTALASSGAGGIAQAPAPSNNAYGRSLHSVLLFPFVAVVPLLMLL